MSGITIAVIIVVIVGIYFAVTYNAFVTLRNRIKEAWSDIEVQMKRRYDLLPNLVETVKGYAAHESGTLEKVIQARNMAMAPHNNMQDVAKSENMLTGALKSIFALSESYPDLKANQNFLELQSQLEGTENRISVARQRFNQAASAYNAYILTFPSNLIAGMFGFDRATLFQADESAQAAPKVEF